MSLSPPEDVDRWRPSLVAGGTGLLAGWNEAEVLVSADVHVARRLGAVAGEEDERVLLALALAVRAVREGSVCVDLATVGDLLTETGGEAVADLSVPEPEAWTAAVLASPLTGPRRPLLHLDGRLYLHRYAEEESQVVADLETRAQHAPAVDERALAAALAELFPDEDFRDQRDATEVACRHLTSVVTGGPGTGKTTTVARLIAVLLRTHPADAPPLRIHLAAPTGKAAARMAQAVVDAAGRPDFPADLRDRVAGLEASTLHRLLGFRPGARGRFRHHRGNRLAADLVVVDESSMLSLTLTARLLEAVRPGARLVLVGDADQLASVDAGAVLTDLVTGLRQRPDAPVAELGPTRRFGRRIGDVADAVRRGDADAVVALLQQEADPDAPVEDGRVTWSDGTDLSEVLVHRALALHAAAEGGSTRDALAELARHRMLCAHRTGPWGATTWNRTVTRELGAALGTHLPEWYAGRPLVVDSNDPGLRLFNGDSAVVCRDGAVGPGGPGGSGRLVGAVEDATQPDGRLLGTTRLADTSTAYALTVHRAQGSQFDEVTLLLPEAGSRALTRELLYTALTRARLHVRVVGSEEALRAAVGRRARRASGLAGRLAAGAGPAHR